MRSYQDKKAIIAEIGRRGESINFASIRLGIPTTTLYTWRDMKPKATNTAYYLALEEIEQLKKQLKDRK